MTTIYNDIINGGIPLEAYGYIYCIINKINGKTYIGKHKFHIYERKDSSIRVEEWRAYMGSGKLINEAIKNYGIDNFDKILLDWSYYDDILAWKEIKYIQKYKDMGQAEYNMVIEYQCDGDHYKNKDKKEIARKTHNRSEKRYIEFKKNHENEIIETYKRLQHIDKTAKELGFGRDKVARVLHDNNVKLNKQNEIGKKISDEKRENISKGVNKYNELHGRKKKGKKKKSNNKIAKMENRKNSINIKHANKQKQASNIRICHSCGFLFRYSSASYNVFTCPQCIQKHNDKINKAKSNARKIFEMHENGKSLRELGRIYEVSDITILNIIKPFAEASNEKKSIGNYGAHLRWHVRKHMKSSDCDYCNDNIGFTDENMVKPEERAHQCFNPDCDNTVIGIANYCSNACREKMIKYLSLFSSHKVAHINKNKYSEYCFYCVHNIDDSNWMHDYNNMRMLVDECDRLNIKRHDDVMKTYESNGTIEGTSKLTGISFPVVKAIVNGLK